MKTDFVTVGVAIFDSFLVYSFSEKFMFIIVFF